MLFKSRENKAHERILEEIESRLARTGAPREIRDFLIKRWSYLLAGIYLNHGDRHPDWEAGWRTVNALLWSLVPKWDRKETEQLLRLLPVLLAQLQDGCDAMGIDAGERDALFSQLAMMHAAVARAGLQANLDEEGPITLLGGDADMEMTEAELDSLGDSTPTVAVADDSKTPTDALGLDSLQVGDGIMLKVSGAERKLFLQWVSPMGGMYLFADDEGFGAVSLTRARLAEKVLNGEARIV